jgi:hypothetical protein
MPGAIRASAISFISGQVIYHHWDESHRLVETAKTFHSLDELLAHCLAPPSGYLVDRITVDGLDTQGRRRQLVLSFQALTEP